MSTRRTLPLKEAVAFRSVRHEAATSNLVAMYGRITRRAFSGSAASLLGATACADSVSATTQSTTPTPPTLMGVAPASQGPVPLLGPDALAAFSLSGSHSHTARLQRVQLGERGGVPFGEVLMVRTEAEPPLEYNIQLLAKTVAPVEKDDVLHASFWIRGGDAAAETSEARTALVFEESKDPYTKSITFSAGAGVQWRQVQIPFKAAAGYTAGGAQIILRLGYAPQTIEIGGVSVVNYGRSASVQNLPRTRVTYAGREPGAAWRHEAQARIEALRKADLSVVVIDSGGHRVSGAAVSVTQRRHAFGFGSAVVAAQIVAQNQDSVRYRETILRLFNKVVMENDLKWENWEDAAQRPRTLRAIQWLRENDVAVRGHTLVWPAWRWVPRDLYDLRADPAALGRRVASHISEEAGALRGQLTDWDVINEPYRNHDLMDILGNDVMMEWFRRAREADPDARLFLNEATAPGTGPAQDHLYATTRFLIDGGAPIGGIGIQCHYGMTVESPPRLLSSLDHFAQLGLPIHITEFDIDTTDEALQEDYTRDFMTAMFSHPAVDAILMWGFWEARHWRPDAALFRRDWSIKPNGRAWTEL
ncbi:MAG TPA: endo-1,4-beta-xylanase, partial [Chloroflexota bacterium]|nr:endo-1,4-beta-xylanase [Chloroflexota bacterium]